MKDKEGASISIYLEDIIYPDYNPDGENWVNYPYSWMRYIWPVIDIYITGLTCIYPLQPQIEDLQKMNCFLFLLSL